MARDPSQPQAPGPAQPKPAPHCAATSVAPAARPEPLHTYAHPYHAAHGRPSSPNVTLAALASQMPTTTKMNQQNDHYYPSSTCI